MNDDLIFRIILGILFVIVIGTRRYFEIRSAKTADAGLVQDRDSSRQIALMSILLTLSNLTLIVFLINPNWMAWSSISLPRWVRWMGVALGATGCALLIWTHRSLGENFFGGTKIREGHQLVTEGPYRRIRHPMYTAFILIGIAWFFLSENWLIAGLWMAATIVVIATRMNAEERMLLHQFGETYQVYSKQTGRFLPKIRSDTRKPDSNSKLK
jgi:protein-S-isoprenylcysteine O-methyltransferase Ste14